MPVIHGQILAFLRKRRLVNEKIGILAQSDGIGMRPGVSDNRYDPPRQLRADKASAVYYLTIGQGDGLPSL
ncbi:hypothetical protein D3C75_1318530 [compost metagenome]